MESPALALIRQAAQSYLPWSSKAACKGQDPRWWFPSAENSLKERRDMKAAISICQGCEVQSDCLQHALAHESDGIWGGMTGKQRKGLKRERRINPVIEHK